MPIKILYNTNKGMLDPRPSNGLAAALVVESLIGLDPGIHLPRSGATAINLRKLTLSFMGPGMYVPQPAIGPNLSLIFFTMTVFKGGNQDWICI